MSDLPNITQTDFIKSVWEDLSSIDLSGYTKTLKHAGNATYLPWSAAWTLLMQRYPHSVEKFKVIVLDNKSVEVRCTLTISNGSEDFTRTMFLPVMDSKNQSIFDPSSRAISDTKQRCLVKCLSKFGLGVHLYSGDELPKLENAPNIPHGNVTADQVKELTALIKKTKSDQTAFLKVIKCEKLEDLPAAKFKPAISLLEDKLKKMEQPA